MTKELILKLRRIGKSITILHVEDDEVISKEIEKLLKKIFQTVDTAKNGQEGLVLYKKNRYDIVISDIHMPLMNGIEMIEAIKKIEPDQTTVVVSAYDDVTYLTRMIEIGIDKFILKPLNMTQFFINISKIVVNIHNERKKNLLEKQLIEELKIKDILLEKLIAPVVILDNDTVTYGNTMFYEYFDIQKSGLQNCFLRDIFHEQELKNLSNFELAKLLEQNNGSTRILLTNLSKKAQRYTVNVTSVENSDKILLCFFNVEHINAELDKIKDNNLYDAVTGLYSRDNFSKKIDEIIYNDDNEYFIICFGLKHLDEFIRLFGISSLQDIYYVIAKKLKTSFNEEIQSTKVIFYYFSSNQFVALVKNDALVSLKEELKVFAKHHSYHHKNRKMKEPLYLDMITIDLDKSLATSEILADVENKLYMLVK